MGDVSPWAIRLPLSVAASALAEETGVAQRLDQSVKLIDDFGQRGGGGKCIHCGGWRDGTGGPGRSSGAGRTSRSGCACGAYRANDSIRPDWSCGTGGSDGTCHAVSAGRSSRPSRTDGTDCTVSAGGSRRPNRSGRTECPSCTGDTRRTNGPSRAGWASRTSNTRGTDCPGGTRGACGTDRAAGGSGGTCGPGRTDRAGSACGSSRSDGSLGPRAAAAAFRNSSRASVEWEGRPAGGHSGSRQLRPGSSPFQRIPDRPGERPHIQRHPWTCGEKNSSCS